MVSLSSTTVEYVRVAEICKEVLFIRNILETMGVEFNIPIWKLFDNVGEIFLSSSCERKHTKYLDMKYHFVREYVEKGIFTVIFVKSVENLEDPFTKNVNVDTYAKHTYYKGEYSDTTHG